MTALFYGATALAPADWNYYYQKGIIEYHANMLDFATENLIRAFEQNPALFDAASMLGDIYERKNKPREAVEWFERSLAVNDRQDAVHVRAARTLDMLGRFDAALSHNKRAIEINPKNVEAYERIIRHLVLFKKRAEAKQYFERCKVVCTAPTWPIIEQAVAEEKKGNDAGAIMLYLQAIQACPTLIDAYFKCAEVHRRNRRYTECLRLLDRIKEIDPDYERAYIYSAHILFDHRISKKRKGLIKLAIKNLEEALRINPSNAETYLLLSEIYVYLRDRDRAMQYNRMAVEIEERKK